ncbi:AraC family transcriptional regulator [Lentzea sp. JNUCC 0626]|uniref:AraC family transcriptional regulator n=1 Tax=Lentzea sp. JNUCC 0626 TaxID=3367513 RepID=UPI00374848AC
MRTLAEPATRHWDFPRGIASVGLLLRFGAEHGLARQDLLADSGITPVQLADPASEISAHQELAVVRNLAARLPHAGVEAGRRYHATTFGVLGHAFLSAATVQDAIDLALRYVDLSFAFTAPTAALRGDLLVIELGPGALPADVAPFLVERDLAAIHTVIGELVGGEVPVVSVEFSHAAPPDVRAHEEVFGTSPHFTASRDQSVVDAALLTRALPLASPEATALCEKQCEDIAARRRRKPEVRDEVRRLLERSARFEETMPDVARALGVSPRTLRRRLSESGTGYQALLDEVRAARAVALLSSGEVSVERAAAALGFAESASFIHAFRRWYGTTPAGFARSRGA